MKWLQNIMIGVFIFSLILLGVNNRETLLSFYNWLLAQSGPVSQLADSVSQLLSLFQ